MSFDLSFLSLINESFEERNERTVGKDKIKGFIISTVNSPDEGYETAIIDKNKVHIVEKYKSKELSIIGHKKWMKLIKNGKRKVKTLGWSDTPFLDDEVILEEE